VREPKEVERLRLAEPSGAAGGDCLLAEFDEPRLFGMEAKVELAHARREVFKKAMLRGRWVEVDHAKLNAALARYAKIERLARGEGISFGKAMRLLAPRRRRRARRDAGRPPIGNR
jgi:hypothetical protein